MSMRREALRYARELGWGVFPIWEPLSDHTCACNKPDCSSPGKHPRTFRGVKNATNDPAQIKRWWDLWPEANIGLSTNNGLVLDVDGRQGEKDLAKLERKHGELPRTVEAETSKGRHIFFSIRRHCPSSTHVLGSMQIDSRGKGGYVLLAPSRHASGFVYEWRRSPFEKKIALAPKWLERLLRCSRPTRPARAREANGDFDGARDETRSGRDARHILAVFRKGYTKSEARAELLRTSSKAREEGDHYIETTIAWAYAAAKSYDESPLFK